MTSIKRCTPTLILLALLAAVTGLTGCGTLMGGDSRPPDRYTLNSDAAASKENPAGNATTVTSSGYTLDLRPVAAPDWLNSKRMLYRLDYADNAQLAAYTRSAWADTPAQMIDDNLNEALSTSGLFAAVLGDASGQSDLALQLELSDFSQHFTSVHKSRGRIVAKATLLRSDNGQVIAQKRFAISAAASSANAAGGVNALTSADNQLDSDVRQWLADTLAHCGTACPSS